MVVLAAEAEPVVLVVEDKATTTQKRMALVVLVVLVVHLVEQTLAMAGAADLAGLAATAAHMEMAAETVRQVQLEIPAATETILMALAGLAEQAALVAALPASIFAACQT